MVWFYFYEFLHVPFYSVVSDFLMMWIVRLLLCTVGLFVHCHKTQNRIQSRCDVGLHVCKYNGPTAKSILFIYVKSHRVTLCERASFRQLALVLLSGDVALNPGPMKCGFANCRSIRNKGPILCEEVKTGNFDIFGLTETHIKALDTPSFLNELTPEDFSLVHTNRENKRGGSVGFFIKSALDFKTLHSPEFSSLENHTVSLTLNGRRMFLGVVYWPPASSVVKIFEDFLSYMGFLSSLSSSFVICGDFNFHVDTMSPTVSEFKLVIDSCCLSQYIDFPTHLHGHTLDLLMAPSKFSAISDVKGSGFISDHKIISCVVDFPSSDTPIQKVVTVSIIN